MKLLDDLCKKPQYIERQREINKDDEFFEFIPSSARYDGEGYWWINGCVGLGKKIIKYYKAVTFAKFVNGEWFFVDWYSVLSDGMPGAAAPCKRE